jgi:hypothetical protein
MDLFENLVIKLCLTIKEKAQGKESLNKFRGTVPI